MSNSHTLHLVEQLVENCGGSTAAAASMMNVSPTTMSRWKSGQTKPTPSHQKRLVQLLAPEFGEHFDVYEGTSSSGNEIRTQRIEATILDALSGVRELSHSHGRFSSQHECLDFIASLFFAHISSIDSGGSGVHIDLISSDDGAAKALSSFISRTYSEACERGDVSKVEAKFTSAAINLSDDVFAREVIEVIGTTTDSIREAQGVGRDDILNSIFSRFIGGSFVDEKEMGQYLTPPEIVRLMTEFGLKCVSADQRAKMLSPEHIGQAGFILDPSCGVASFLGEAVQQLTSRARRKMSAKELDKWSQELVRKKIVGVDKSERMAHLAVANLSLFGAGGASVFNGNALVRNDERFSDLVEKCSLILTNPPFGASYSGDDIAGFEVAKRQFNKGKAIDSEVLFFERYVDWLLPDGVLVSIVPDNVLTGQGIYKELREFLFQRLDLIAVVSLPPVTFAAAGTSTKTSILVARKKANPTNETRAKTYFGVARAVGFDVLSRGGYRRRRPTTDNDLPVIRSELMDGEAAEMGIRRALKPTDKRWDALFNSHTPNTQESKALQKNQGVVVSDIAELIDERTHPKRKFEGQFPYIEISDIDAQTGWVNAKSVSIDKAPSRARKVVRFGDVLVSTVRPERGAIGVVPSHLDGAICSTGIAVLRPTGVEPQVLRKALSSDEVRSQMERHNVGIAYPAISEKDLVNFTLSVSHQKLSDLAPLGKAIDAALAATFEKMNDLEASLRAHMD